MILVILSTVFGDRHSVNIVWFSTINLVIGKFSGFFAHVGDTLFNVPASSSDKSSIYVLESPKFNLKQPAILKYELFQKSVGPTLHVSF